MKHIKTVLLVFLSILIFDDAVPQQAQKKYDSTSYAYRNNSGDFKIFESNGKYGLINRKGKVIIPPMYDFIKLSSSGVLVRFVGKYGVFDYSGKEIIPPKYEEIRNFKEGAAPIKLNGKWGFIDETGKEIVPVKYQNVLDFNEGIAAIKLNDKWGFIDDTGKEIIPPKYEEVRNFNEGLAAIKSNGKWGFIDYTGKEIVPPKYDDISYFRNGVAEAKIRGDYTYKIDKTGKVIDYYQGPVEYPKETHAKKSYEEPENSPKYAQKAMLIGIPLLYLGSSIYLYEYKYRNNRDANWMGGINAYTGSALLFGSIGFIAGFITGLPLIGPACGSGQGCHGGLWIVVPLFTGFIGAAVGIPVGLYVANKNGFSHYAKHHRGFYYAAPVAVTIPLFVFAIRF